MKINELLNESQQQELAVLQEGPILNKIGRGVGKVAGTAAKAVGSVAGGVAGLGSAFMKGFRGGKDTVAAAGDDDEAGGDTTTTSGSSGGTGSSGSTASGGAAKTSTATAGPASEPAAAPAAEKPAAKPKSTFGKLTTAAAGGAPDKVEPTLDDPKTDTAYAQAQKAVNGLAPEQKKEIVTMLQSDPKVKAAMEKPVAKKPAAAPAPAAEPAAAPAAPAAPAAEPAAKKPAATAPAEPKPNKRKPAKKPAGPSQAEIDADRARIMGPTSDSIVRTKASLTENFSLFRRS